MGRRAPIADLLDLVHVRVAHEILRDRGELAEVAVLATEARLRGGGHVRQREGMGGREEGGGRRSGTERLDITNWLNREKM